MQVSNLRIKKFNTKIGHAQRIEFKNVYFDDAELEFIKTTTNLKELTFKNCVFNSGVKISNLECNYIGFYDCSFASSLGIKLEDVAAYQFIVNTCRYQPDSDENSNLKLGSEIFSYVIALRSCKLFELIIINSEFGLEIIDSTVEKKIELSGLKSRIHPENESVENDKKSLSKTLACLLTYEELNSLGAFRQLNILTRSDKFNNKVNSVLVKNSKLGGEFLISNSNIGSLSFESVSRTSKTSGAMFSFETSFFKDISFKKFICEDIYLSFENVIFSNLEAVDSKLGKNLNCFISSTCDEEDRRVNSVEILRSEVVKSNFSNRLIDNPLNFSETTFKNAPSLFNTVIPLESIFPPRKYFHVDESQESILRFKLLRKHMEDIRDRDREGDFFQLEQKCLAKRKDVQGNAIRKMYSLFSSYGTSASKPIYWLLGSFLFFTLCYALMLSPQVHYSLPIDWELISKSIHFSLKQTLIPFWSLRDFTPLYDKNTVSSLLILPAILQSAMSAAFITLSFLSIRWRFKRG